MAATIVAAASGNAQATSVDCPKPAGTADGDVLVAFHTSDWGDYTGMTAPAGFSLVTGLDRGTNDIHLKAWVKTAGGSEPTDYTFGQSGNPDGCVSIIALRDATAAGLVFVTPVWQASGSTARTVPSLTGVPAGAVQLCCANLEAPNGPNSFTPPPGMDEQTDVQSTNWNSHSVASLLSPPATTGVRTFTSSSTGLANGGIGASIAVPAAAAAGVTGSGAASAAAAQATGSGQARVSGSGSAAAASASVAGAGSLGAVQVNGSGAATTHAAQTAGSGTVTAAGSGNAAAPAGTAAGSATAEITGTGAATAPAATVAGRESPPGPFVAGVSGLHFVDADGQPILVRGDTVWAFPVNAGRWNGGDWQGDLDAYFTARAGQGFNALYHAVLGSTQNNGPSNDGATADGVLPFVAGEPGSLNEAYWQRVDHMLTRAEGLGSTIFLNFAYSDDLDNAALAGKSGAQCHAYGAALGARYGNRPNLVWGVGGDYFGFDDTRVGQILAGIRSAGDTHLIAIQYYPETTSRQDLSSGSVQAWGAANAQYNFVYTYNVAYFGVEQAYAEPSPIPVLWGDGTYDDDSVSDRLVMRNHTWWAFTSGSRGNIYGSDGVWNWGSGSLAQVQSSTFGFADVDLPVIRDAFAALGGWHLLLPDLDSSLVTAGRGTRATSLASGGGGGQYSGSPQDTWVTAGVTPDGTLAVVYCPVSTTVTVDDTELVASYSATWIDPVSGAATAETVGGTYTTPGTNSVGDNDWVLVLAEADAPAITGTGQAAVAAAHLDGGAAVTAAGAGEATTPAPALSGQATVTATGAGQATAAPPQAAAAGTVQVRGSGVATTAAPAAVGAAAVHVAGSGAATAAPARAASDGDPAPWIRTPTRVDIAQRVGSVVVDARFGTVLLEARTPVTAALDERAGSVLLEERYATATTADRHGAVDSHTEGQVALLEAHGTVLEA